MIYLNEELISKTSMYVYIISAYIVPYQSGVFTPRKSTVPKLSLPQSDFPIFYICLPHILSSENNIFSINKNIYYSKRYLYLPLCSFFHHVFLESP